MEGKYELEYGEKVKLDAKDKKIIEQLQENAKQSITDIAIDDKGQKWSGAEYKKIQEEKKAASKDKFITTGRGTGKIKFGDIKSTSLPSTKGLWVSSGRGTKKRKL